MNHTWITSYFDHPDSAMDLWQIQWNNFITRSSLYVSYFKVLHHSLGCWQPVCRIPSQAFLINFALGSVGSFFLTADPFLGDIIAALLLMAITVLFQSIWPSCITGQVDMAEMHHLSWVTEAVASVKKPLSQRPKFSFFWALWAAFNYPSKIVLSKKHFELRILFWIQQPSKRI